jgi:hypothetical protein
MRPAICSALLLLAASLFLAPAAQAAKLTVRVSLQDGRQAGAGVSVRVRSGDGSYDQRRVTDGKSRADFQNVPKGPATVSVERAGARAEQPIQVTRKKHNVNVTLVVQAAPPPPPTQQPPPPPPPQPEPAPPAPPPTEPTPPPPPEAEPAPVEPTPPPTAETEPAPTEPTPEPPPPAKPDLVVEAEIVAVSERSISWGYRITNVGVGDADLTGVYVAGGPSRQPTWPPEVRPVNYPFKDPRLPSGQTVTNRALSMQVEPGTLDPGDTWYFMARVDNLAGLDEANENNNVASVPLDVSSLASTPPEAQPPVITQVSPIPDGYHVSGREFGLDLSQVVVYEGQDALPGSAISSLSPTEIYVRSVTSGSFDVSVEVAGVRSEAVAYTAPSPPTPSEPAPQITAVESQVSGYTIRGSGFGRDKRFIDVFEKTGTSERQVGLQDVLNLQDTQILVRSLTVQEGSEIRVEVNDVTSNSVAIGAIAQPNVPVVPTISGITSTPDGYRIAGEDFGSDASQVEVYEAGQPLASQQIASVTPTAIGVQSQPSEPVGIFVKVGAANSTVMIYEPPLPALPPIPVSDDPTTYQTMMDDPSLNCHACHFPELEAEPEWNWVTQEGDTTIRFVKLLKPRELTTEEYQTLPPMLHHAGMDPGTPTWRTSNSNVVAILAQEFDDGQHWRRAIEVRNPGSATLSTEGGIIVSQTIAVLAPGGQPPPDEPPPVQGASFNDVLLGVFQHPRCQNCHNGFRPPVVANLFTADPNDVIENHAELGAGCGGCHVWNSDQSGAAPDFGAAAQGLCEAGKDPGPHASVVEHLTEDALIHWALFDASVSFDGRSVQLDKAFGGSEAQFDQAVQAWIDGGCEPCGPCPPNAE